MADPELYSGPGEIWYNTTPVLEAQSIEVSLATNNNTVKTLKKGRAGNSKGFNEYSISVNSAIPKSGIEIDWEGLAENGEPFPLRFRLAGKWRDYIGDIRDVRMSTSTDNPNSISFTYSCSKKTTST